MIAQNANQTLSLYVEVQSDMNVGEPDKSTIRDVGLLNSSSLLLSRKEFELPLHTHMIKSLRYGRE
jgi:hypothetical protein